VRETPSDSRAPSSGTFFSRAGRGTKTDAPELELELQPGRRIGDYTLVLFLARGGMGQVWEARDETLARSVALKLVLPERLDERNLALFAREARAGGRMNHPNIVTTLAYGSDEGLSWIAQELVEGSWTLRDFLGVLRTEDAVPEGYYRRVAGFVAQVADGLQAAHDAGVVHRDVKPQNILITGDGTPKVTDFGLARVTEDPFQSRSGEVAGTWAYMSPEQVTGKLVELDHRTDVFSLGVVLYEMLTLRRPFEGDTTQQLAHQIVFRDPPDARGIRSECPRDLAVIASKALEKPRSRRYGSMAELAADLRRSLANEPIQARPPGAVERSLKWMRRHPTPSAAAAVLLVALAVIGGLLAEYVDKADELSSANTELLTRKLELEAKSEELHESNEILEARSEELRNTNEALGLAKTAVEQEKGRAIEERDRLAEVVSFLEALLGDLDAEAFGVRLRLGARDELAATLRSRGADDADVQAAVDALDAVIDPINFTDLGAASLEEELLRPATAKLGDAFQADALTRARVSSAIANAYRPLGLFEPGEELLLESLRLRREELSDEHPDTLAAASELGVYLRTMGRLEEALSHAEFALEGRRRVLGDEHPDTLKSVANMGSLLEAMGRLEQALPYFEEAFDVRSRVLGNDHLDTLLSLNNLGHLLGSMNRQEEAMDCYQEALDGFRDVHGDRHSATLVLINNIGALYQSQGELEEARPYCEEALEGAREVLGDEHPDTLTLVNNLGALLRAQGELEEAELYFREALDGNRRALGNEHPATLRSLNNMGGLLGSKGRLDEALPYYREALEGYRRVLGPEHPDTLGSTVNMGALLEAMGSMEEALPYYEEAYAEGRRLFGDSHRLTRYAKRKLEAAQAQLQVSEE